MSPSTPVATSEVMFQRPKTCSNRSVREVLVEQARKLALPPIESGAKQQVAVSN